ncbi:hypothetical protein [Sporosarcina highlanderae]|uniref:DUF3139 domain-containing protein n=1 Tax=Sporosarcina highlanderae TaxID=3035916 RepID=A0ABT8JW45_9BACL|nr:hypothetical protein [Sporosarcina highlanderae]MDN4608567.1 hypothetical protein [Sporosarcina highlanderae]
MRWKRSTKIYFLIVLIIVILVGFNLYSFYKLNTVKIFVEEYLEEEGYTQNEISVIDKFKSNLAGDRHWMVVVRLEGDQKVYYYFKSKNKLILESYILDGYDNVVNKVVKTRHSE